MESVVAEPCISPENFTMNTKHQAQNPTLPQELILNEILVRLPAKFIGRLRTVSKLWRSLLSNQHFVKSHFNFHSAIPSPPKLISVCPTTLGLHTLTFTSTNTVSSSSRIDAVSKMLEKCDRKWTHVLGSGHGLVLAGNEEPGKCIVNPTTQELVKVPELSLALDPTDLDSYYSVDGFGYDSSTEDYKIVTLTFPRKTDRVETFVHVYSLKMKTWRRVGNFPYGHTSRCVQRGVFVNGALHWLVTGTTVESSPTTIAAFKLSDEKFEQMPAPSSFEVYDTPFIHVFGECLGMVIRASHFRGYTVWVLKEYGMPDSWTKFSITGSRDALLYSRPICQLGNEEVVLLQDNTKLFLHNLKKQISTEMEVDGVLDAFPHDIIDFSESLVSPSFSGWDKKAQP